MDPSTTLNELLICNQVPNNLFTLYGSSKQIFGICMTVTKMIQYMLVSNELHGRGTQKILERNVRKEVRRK
jgi:hypothetical protein